MTDLLNIAKECGAELIETRTTKECAAVIMSISELHATVEKVCGPLVEALTQISCGTCGCDSWEYCRNSEPNDTASEAIAAYKTLLGISNE